MNTLKERNQTVDVIRGVAMLLVVLGHTLSGCTSASEDSLLYNIIWSLQMPLFMVVSGYVTRFSRSIDTGKQLRSFIGKRTLAYLLPWVVFTLVVRGLISGQISVLRPSYLLYHMDVGYWFLFSIWTITMIYGIAVYLARLLCRNGGGVVKSSVLTIVFCLAGAAVLAAIGAIFGLSFLCIRLTLYYIPFYMAGWLFGKCRDWLFADRRRWLPEGAVAVAVIAYLVLISRVNLFRSADTLFGIASRMAISLLGVIAVCGLIAGVVRNGKVTACFAYVGVHSLEVYLSHYLFLSILQFGTRPPVDSVAGMVLVAANFVFTVLLTLGFNRLISANRYLNFALFGKR